MKISTDPAPPSIALPLSLRTIDQLLADVAAPSVVCRFVLSEGSGMGKTRTFLINGKSFDMQRIDTVVRVGAVERWDVENTSTMDHPLHVHGTLFQVISRTRNGREVAEPFIAWRDTVNVPLNSMTSFLIRQNDL